METDVLICGAGAAGLTLAVELARRGAAFRLIDAAAQPFAGSRGKGIQPRSLEVFEDLGVVVGEGVGLIETAVFFGDHLPQMDVLFWSAHLPRATTSGVGQGEKKE